MKKFGKALAILASLSFVLSGLLASCSSDSGGGGSSTVKVTEITIEGSASVGTGGSIELTATVSPDNATNKKLTWTANPESAVSITPSEDTLTATVTGVSETAAVVITATAQDGSGISAEKTIAVTKQVKSIAVDVTGAKTTYNVGEESLNTDGIVVTATYADDTTAEVDVTHCTFTGFDSSESGTKTITVSYSGKTTTFNVTFAKIRAIAVNTDNMKKTYVVGEELNTSGIVITATYSDGENETSGEISADDCEFAGFSSETGGTTSEITVSLKSDSTITTTFSVTIKGADVTLSSVTIKEKPAKTAYFVGDELDLTGLVLALTYSDGDEADVTYSSTSAAISATGFSSETASEEVTVTVNYSGFAGSAPTFTVSVIEDYITEWTATLASGVSYTVGDTASADDVVVAATYAKAGAKNLTAGTDYTVSPATALAASNTTLTVTLSDSLNLGEGVVASKEVSISVVAADAKITQFTVALADGVSFTEGDTVVAGNLVVKAVYDGNEASAVAVGATQFSFTPTAALTASDTKITVTITDETLLAKLKDDNVSKTAEVTISVAEKSTTIEYTNTMTLTFNEAYYTNASDWSGVPIRTSSGNASALVTRADGTKTGYLGRTFWLVDGVYAEFTSSAGLGYCNSEADATHTSTDFLKAIESEAITGPFKLSVTTSNSNATRKFKIYVSSSKETLWDSTPVVDEKFTDNSNVHSYEYTGTDAVYIGIGTTPDSSDKKVYTSISEIKVESKTEIAEDTWPATGVAFTNNDISDNALTLAKDDAYTFTAEVTPTYATNKNKTFSYTKTSEGTQYVSVDSETGTVTIADGLTGTETGTVTVTAAGGINVTKSITLSVVAELSDAQKVVRTKVTLQTALESFTYENTTTALANAQALVNETTFDYATASNIVPSLDSATGKITFTITIGNATDTVVFEYTEELAQAAVDAAVTAIKKLSAYTWTTDAATTKSTIDAALASSYTDVTVTTVADTAKSAVKFTVTSSIITTVSTEWSLSPYYTEYFDNETTADSVNTYASGVKSTGDKAKSSSVATKVYDPEPSYAVKLANDLTKNITIPVWGNCDIVLVHVADGTTERGVKASVTSGSIRALSATAFAHDSETTTADTVVAKTADNKKSAYATVYNKEVKVSSILQFTYSGSAGTVTLTNTKADMESKGAGGIYIYLIDVTSPSQADAGLTINPGYPSSDNDVTIAATTGATNSYTVSGGAVTGGTIAWYIDDTLVSGETSATITLPTSLTKGTSYTLRVVVTSDGNTYSDDITVVKQ